ncbi:MAG: hypothetical protein INQ03_08185 [Candidatus Heimdallarchaeota archaeon]|nr:hypothetical protein [Candidatus Heimdallarchaeota archaeon]
MRYSVFLLLLLLPLSSAIDEYRPQWYDDESDGGFSSVSAVVVLETHELNITIFWDQPMNYTDVYRMLIDFTYTKYYQCDQGSCFSVINLEYNHELEHFDIDQYSNAFDNESSVYSSAISKDPYSMTFHTSILPEMTDIFVTTLEDGYEVSINVDCSMNYGDSFVDSYSLELNTDLTSAPFSPYWFLPLIILPLLKKQ